MGSAGAWPKQPRVTGSARPGQLGQGQLGQGQLGQGQLGQGQLEQGQLEQGQLDQGQLDQDTPGDEFFPEGCRATENYGGQTEPVCGDYVFRLVVGEQRLLR